MSGPEAPKEKKDSPEPPKSSADKLKGAIKTMSENGILVAIAVFVVILIIAFWGDMATILLNMITEKTANIINAFVPAKVATITLFREVIGTVITLVIVGLIIKEIFKKVKG